MRSTKMIVFALLNETGGCFLDPGLGLLVEHPLDQSPKRVGWNGFRKMGTRVPRENTSKSPDGTPAVTKTTREAKCGHVCAIFWYNASPSISGDNLSVTLEKMRKIGDVTLTRREGKIRTVSPFDYSAIKPFKGNAPLASVGVLGLSLRWSPARPVADRRSLGTRRPRLEMPEPVAWRRHHRK